MSSLKAGLTDSIRHGAQGQMDGASKATLENEFGTSNEDECIKQILTKGNLQVSEVGIPLDILDKTDHLQNSERGGDRNITQGPGIAHGGPMNP
jgi:hypothetical protein